MCVSVHLVVQGQPAFNSYPLDDYPPEIFTFVRTDYYRKRPAEVWHWGTRDCMCEHDRLLF